MTRIDFDTTLTVEPHLAVFKGYDKIDGREMKNKYKFTSNDEAFDAAAEALKKLLLENGYICRDGCYVKA